MTARARKESFGVSLGPESVRAWIAVEKKVPQSSKCRVRADLELMVVDASRLVCVEQIECLLDLLLLLLAQIGALAVCRATATAAAEAEAERMSVLPRVLLAAFALLFSSSHTSLLFGLEARCEAIFESAVGSTQASEATESGWV